MWLFLFCTMVRNACQQLVALFAHVMQSFYCWISYVNWLGMCCNMWKEIWSRTELIRKHNRIAQKNKWLMFFICDRDEIAGKKWMLFYGCLSAQLLLHMHLGFKSFCLTHSMSLEFRTLPMSSERFFQLQIASWLQHSNCPMSSSDWQKHKLINFSWTRFSFAYLSRIFIIYRNFCNLHCRLFTSI